jgi:hypothetical protein
VHIENGKRTDLDSPERWLGLLRSIVGLASSSEKSVAGIVDKALAKDNGFVGKLLTDHDTAEGRRQKNVPIWSHLGCGLAQASALPEVPEDRLAFKLEMRNRVGEPPDWAKSEACAACGKMSARRHVSLRYLCGACTDKTRQADPGPCTQADPGPCRAFAFGKDAGAPEVGGSSSELGPRGLACARGFFMALIKDLVIQPKNLFVLGATFEVHKDTVSLFHHDGHIDAAELQSALRIIGTWEVRVRNLVQSVLRRNAAIIDGMEVRLSTVGSWVRCMLGMLGLFEQCDLALGEFVNPLIIRGGKCAEPKDGKCQAPCTLSQSWLGQKCVREPHITAYSRGDYKAQWKGAGCWRAGSMPAAVAASKSRANDDGKAWSLEETPQG